MIQNIKFDFDFDFILYHNFQNIKSLENLLFFFALNGNNEK